MVSNIDWGVVKRGYNLIIPWLMKSHVAHPYKYIYYYDIKCSESFIPLQIYNYSNREH